MQKLQQNKPPQKQIQKAIWALNEVLDKKGDETLTVTPMELFDSGFLSRTSFFRYFDTIDSIMLFAKDELTEIFSRFFSRKALFLKLSHHDFFTCLFNTLYSHKATVKLLIRRQSKKHWQDMLQLLKPIVERTPLSNRDELVYGLFALVFIRTLEWWMENGFKEEDIPACANRLTSFLNFFDLTSQQNIFVFEKLLGVIRLLIE